MAIVMRMGMRIMMMMMMTMILTTTIIMTMTMTMMLIAMMPIKMQDHDYDAHHDAPDAGIRHAFPCTLFRPLLVRSGFNNHCSENLFQANSFTRK